MAEHPEARAQLARLLGDASLRHAPPEALRRAIEASFETLVDGLTAEAAAGDDVYDRASALSFIDLRLEALAGLLDSDLRARLRQAVVAKTEAW